MFCCSELPLSLLCCCCSIDSMDRSISLQQGQHTRAANASKRVMLPLPPRPRIAFTGNCCRPVLARHQTARYFIYGHSAQILFFFFVCALTLLLLLLLWLWLLLLLLLPLPHSHDETGYRATPSHSHSEHQLPHTAPAPAHL